MAYLFSSCLDLIYPPHCIHCSASILGIGRLFCEECLSQLHLIDSRERCPRCFSADYLPLQSHCYECSHRQIALDGIAAAFDYDGPAAALVRHIKYGGRSYLTAGASGYMVGQFLSMGWPFPDIIVPVPISWTRQLDRGYNQSLLLANGVAKVLGCSVLDALYRQSGGFSQAGLTRRQRLQLNEELYFVKPKFSFENKSILLIDDVMTTGMTLHRCAEAIACSFPKSIYALTLCRAIF